MNQLEERDKQSYQILKSGMPSLPDFTLARVDSYDIKGLSSISATEGVLANDEQWEGGEMQALL